MSGFQSKGPGQSHRVLQEWRVKYGDLYKYFLGQVPYVVVSGEHPSLLQLIYRFRVMMTVNRAFALQILP